MTKNVGSDHWKDNLGSLGCGLHTQTMSPIFRGCSPDVLICPERDLSCTSRIVSLASRVDSSARNCKPCNCFVSLSLCAERCTDVLRGSGWARTGKQISLDERRGARPKTRLKGERPSVDTAGVILLANEISVRRLDHSGAEVLVDLILSSTVRVLCWDSHSPFVLG